jgi:hypothetical protein
MLCYVQSILDADRRWGVMEDARWRTFLRWLSDSGLLTTKVLGLTAIF